MTVQLNQDSQFITQVRRSASGILDEADRGPALESEWNTCFGGASRLGAGSFSGENEGLTKADIENANNVIISLKTWLDEAGQNRRLYLQNVRILRQLLP